MIDPKRFPPPSPESGPLQRCRAPERVKERSRGLQRGKPINPRNAPRAKKAHDECFGPCANMARLLGCVVPSCFRRPQDGAVELRPRWKIEAAHVRSRGAGGKDWGNCVGLCSLHHRQQGDVGILTFQKRHGLDLAAAASRIASAVQEHECVAWQKQGRCAVCLREVA